MASLRYTYITITKTMAVPLDDGHSKATSKSSDHLPCAMIGQADGICRQSNRSQFIDFFQKMDVLLPSNRLDLDLDAQHHSPRYTPANTRNDQTYGKYQL